MRIYAFLVMFLLSGCATAQPEGTTEQIGILGGLTNPVTSADGVKERLKIDLLAWSDDPNNATGCNSADCCANATAAECEAFAQNFISQPDTWVRTIYSCIQEDGDWACQVMLADGDWAMICQTIPATDALRLKDVADCASSVAAVQN